VIEPAYHSPLVRLAERASRRRLVHAGARFSVITRSPRKPAVTQSAQRHDLMGRAATLEKSQMGQRCRNRERRRSTIRGASSPQASRNRGSNPPMRTSCFQVGPCGPSSWPTESCAAMWASSWHRTSSRRERSLRKVVASVIVRVSRLVRAQLFDKRVENRVETVSPRSGRDQSSAYRAIDSFKARRARTSAWSLVVEVVSDPITVAADAIGADMLGYAIGHTPIEQMSDVPHGTGGLVFA